MSRCGFPGDSVPRPAASRHVDIAWYPPPPGVIRGLTDSDPRPYPGTARRRTLIGDDGDTPFAGDQIRAVLLARHTQRLTQLTGAAAQVLLPAGTRTAGPH